MLGMVSYSIEWQGLDLVCIVHGDPAVPPHVITGRTLTLASRSGRMCNASACDQKFRSAEWLLYFKQLGFVPNNENITRLEGGAILYDILAAGSLNEEHVKIQGT